VLSGMLYRKCRLCRILASDVGVDRLRGYSPLSVRLLPVTIVTTAQDRTGRSAQNSVRDVSGRRHCRADNPRGVF
jgi:hypothetical protein